MRFAEGTLAEVPRNVRSNIVGPVLSVVAANCHGALKQSIDENHLSLKDLPSRVGDTEPGRAVDLREGQTASGARRPLYLKGVTLDERGIPVSTSWLAKQRLKGGGPPYIKMGGAVRYNATVLQEWMKGKQRLSTSGT